ncbi:hypothetical protein SAMN05421788_113152 [Filimonas lacunae]|uniref:Uncharacterized protein n=2 Tax=Filimonas lacunae TaxID=477680 RepID=A0A173MBG9_9BACT|nr:ankyrin repeat domain-containing protein [Filimonas lacunae]BAV04895.1 ankyrin-repeat containing protein [Filimonas lacunae]SIT33838.1 hypothetical protein SAMN05421788_113152 [Filimonas lacunae]
MTIFEAARSGDLSALQTFIAAGDINRQDERGSTALILASYYNQAAAVSLLLQAHAAMELKDTYGNTALMGAAFKGYLEIVELLLFHGASMHTENKSGATALTYAATFGRDAIAQLLLHYGAASGKKGISDRIRLIGTFVNTGIKETIKHVFPRSRHTPTAQ